MKLNPKPWATLFFVLVVVLAATPSFSFSGKSEDTTSHENLMSSMGISRLVDEVKAPDFALKDLNGKKIRLSHLRGKVVIINFWTTW